MVLRIHRVVNHFGNIRKQSGRTASYRSICHMRYYSRTTHFAPHPGEVRPQATSTASRFQHKSFAESKEYSRVF